ncbi:primary cilium assembly protein FAM149B1 [Pelodytes ibericus]
MTTARCRYGGLTGWEKMVEDKRRDERLTPRMISRYKRKPVSQNLQLDLAKAIENHPPPEADSSSPGTERYDPALRCTSESDTSDTAHFSEADTQDSWPECPRGTGFSADDSSLGSWGFDEFDQAATRQVHKIFKQIDELLYERKTSSGLEGLQEECQEWTLHFPHLRVQGKQIVPPLEEGYSWHSSHPCESSASAVLPLSAHTRDSNELGILGTRCSFASDSRTQVSFSLSTEKEVLEGDDVGILLAEGVVEEYFAFDSRDKEDELFEWTRAMSLDSLKMGYPPISPKYCNKEAVLASLFDDVWKEAVGCLEELICRHWEETLTDDDRHDITIKTTRVGSLHPNPPSQRLPLVLPPVHHAKIPANSPNMANRSHGGGTMIPRNLSDLITIHGIPLQQRNLLPADKVLDLDDKSPLRPTSAALISGKPRPGRSLEHSSSSLSHNVSSARRRNPPRTLHPINNNTSRSGTPKVEEVIRGTRLHGTSEQLPCSPVSFNRNNLLPPIGTSDVDNQNIPGSQGLTPDTQLRSSFVGYDPYRTRRGSDGIGIPLSLSLRSNSRGGHLTRSRQGL